MLRVCFAAVLQLVLLAIFLGAGLASVCLEAFLLMGNPNVKPELVHARGASGYLSRLTWRLDARGAGVVFSRSRAPGQVASSSSGAF